MSQYVINSGMRKLAIGATVMLFFLLMIPSIAFAASGTYTVKVDTGYLALRTAPAYDDGNIIAQLYTGDTVEVSDSSSNSDYWKVYSPTYNRSGWVNKNYLIGKNTSGQSVYRVKVEKNYLALRTAPDFDRDNEVGKLYTDDTVTLISVYNDTYWWVYSPKYDREGYVNKNYLTLESSSDEDYTVKVNTGYLALRTQAAYDDSNVIGKLYTGDVVVAKNKYNGQYWWVYSQKLGKEGYVNKSYLVKR